MRYLYSVVRFVPDPIRGEFVNVGIIVGCDESSEWEIRTVENHRRARSLDDKGLLSLVWDPIEEIGRRIDEYAEDVQISLFDKDERVSERWLMQLSEESRNLVQFSTPAPIVAEDIDQALRILLGQFIVEPEPRRYPVMTKHKALAATRKAYTKAGLKLREHFNEGPNVNGRYHQERFDFIVMNGQAVQLTQTWSFQVASQNELAENIKAWSWTVKDIRDHGGSAETKTRKIEVPRDVDIEVVYVPPLKDGPGNVLDEALAAFDIIQVTAVESGKAQSIGIKAKNLLNI